MTPNDIVGRVALVTGASGGIGRAIAAALASAGAHVGVHWNTGADGAKAAVAAVEAAGTRALSVQADLRDADAVDRMAAAVEQGLGPVDILVNNAGWGYVKPFARVTMDDLDTALTDNLKTAFLVTERLSPGMRERRWGRIVFFGSIAARTGGRLGVHYAAAKAAVEGLAHGYAQRLVGDSIAVNCIVPTLIAHARGAPPVDPTTVPVRRHGSGEEVAAAVLLAVRTGFMTGQSLHLNGGTYFT
ncbi:MAG: SDR family NAD(P)-dependent oxidoreductase [Alphaproteobacteria bacterium]